MQLQQRYEEAKKKKKKNQAQCHATVEVELQAAATLAMVEHLQDLEQTTSQVPY